MILSVLTALAVVFTVVRSWPQFLHIVVKKEREGVSAMTWMLALSSHVGWFMYGVLSPVPLFVIVNALAGLGCAATVWTLRSWKPVAVVAVASASISSATFAIADPVMLGLVVALSFGMFVPQLVKVFRTSAQGVSLTAWTLAAAASATWIAYGWAISRPTVAIAHFFMFPASLLIIGRTLFDTRTPGAGLRVATTDPLD